MNVMRSVCLMVLLLALVLPVDAAEKGNTSGDQKVSSTAARPAYVPPLRGAPSGRVGGGTRGTSMGSEALTLEVLAPDHLGLTTQVQPCLYWFISKPTSLAVELTVTEQGSSQPLIEKALPSPATGGIKEFCLTDHDARLRPGTTYKWFVALIPDAGNRSRDLLAGGIVELVDAPASLQKKLMTADKSDAVCAYAEEGYWYDAFESAMKNDDGLEQRAALIDQVGLTGVVE
jgi:hypothetical protein